MESGVICGYGTVGKTTAKALSIPYYVDIDDNNISDKDLKSIGVYVICLPTPTVAGKQDLSAIHEWLKRIKKGYQPPTVYSDNGNPKVKPLVILRSTVLPGTTKTLQEEYPDIDIVHVPEFLTMSSAMADAHSPELLVIGTKDLVLIDIVKHIFGRVKNKKLICCSPTTAELIKYTMNSFFSLKVVFANQLWDVSKKVGADYSKVVEALESHKWGSRNGWDVWQGGFRGYGGACLPKDIEAFYKKFELPLLEATHKINKKLVEATQ